MQSKVDSFNKSSEGHGKRYYPIPEEFMPLFQLQLEAFDRWLGGLRTAMLPTRTIDVYVDFIDRGDCNAYATIVDGLGIIGMYKGAILLPADVFARMFSHPSVHPAIGDVSKEAIGPQHSDDIPCDFNELIANRKQSGRSAISPLPNDHTRNMLSAICWQIARDFIAIHELVHILHGHLDYLGKDGKIPLLLEVVTPNSKGSRAESMTRQALEVWADAIAVSVGLAAILRGGDGSVNVLDKVLHDPERRLYFWAFSIFALFKIWVLWIDPNGMRQEDHPPTAMRFELVMLNALLEVEAKYPDLKGTFWNTVHDAQRAADYSFELIGGTRVHAEDIEATRGEAAKSHRLELLTYLENTLYEEIVKVSYVPIPRHVVRP